jgi:hypothetical protein
MKFENVRNKGQAQLYENKYLEMLTKAHPLLIWGMYIPIISYLLYYSNTSLNYTVTRIVLTFLAGIFSGHFLSTWLTGLYFT